MKTILYNQDNKNINNLNLYQKLTKRLRGVLFAKRRLLSSARDLRKSILRRESALRRQIDKIR